LRLCADRRAANEYDRNQANLEIDDSASRPYPGLFYDDPSSPQATRKKMTKVKLGLKNLTRDQELARVQFVASRFEG
jgi:hypothetical protein